MAFRIDRGVFKFYDTNRADYISKFKIDEDSGQIVELDEAGNITDGYLTTSSKAADSNLLDGLDSSAFLRSNASDDMYGTLTVHSGGANSYGRIRGYGNDNHFIVMRGIVSTNTSTLTITGGHRTTFVEHAEANDNTGWYFVSKQTGKYQEVARITRYGITAPNYNDSNWNTAYNWGNHASAGYLNTSVLSEAQAGLLKTSLGVSGLPYTCDIVLNGDPNLFYPVHFFGGDQNIWRRIIISRNYSWQAPPDWYSATHKGGLLLDWEGNFGGWGGATYSDRLRVFNEQYSNMVADMYRYTHSMGYVFFLRGGGDTGALYRIFSDQPINGRHQSGTPDIGYDSSFVFYPNSNASYVVTAPEPLTLAQINTRRIDELRTLKRSELNAIYQPVGSYLTTSGKAADSNLLDGINSTSFLRSDANDTASGRITLTYNDPSDPLTPLEIRGAGNHTGLYINPYANKQAHVRFASNGSLKWQIRVPFQDGANSEMKIYSWVDGADRFRFGHNGDFYADGDLNSDEVRSRNYWIGNALYFGGGNNYINWTGSNRIYTNAPMQVAGSISGKALQVGNGTSFGVLTSDNARNQLVVGATHYPHLVISADGGTNTNHGAVLSFVGKEGSSARQWNIGTSNTNPFLFSIGYNETGDNNPHYGIGDNWGTESSKHHARLLIDRSGNVKIRGSLYVNGTKGGITTGSKVATETFTTDAIDAAKEDLLNGAISTAQTTADNAATAAATAQTTATTAETRANETKQALADLGNELGSAAYTASTAYLGATAKAADSDLIDGIDSSRIVYGANARRSNRYDNEGIVSTNQNSGFYYGYNPNGAPFNEWWNWITVAGASWTSGNNYDFKLAHNFHGDDFYVSRMAGGTQYSWRKIIDSGNISSQSVSYASQAGEAEFAFQAETAGYAGSAGFADSASSANTAASVAWSGVTGKPSTFAPSTHTHDYAPLNAPTFTSYISLSSAFLYMSNDMPIVWGASTSIEGGASTMKIRAGGRERFWTNNGTLTKVYGTTGGGIQLDGEGCSAMDTFGVRYNLMLAQDFLRMSDISEKENISTLTDSVSKVKSLRGVEFDWKSDGKHDIGFIAQEVETIIPEAIKAVKGKKMVSYTSVVPLLVEAIKEQQTVIDSLIARIEALENK